MVGGSSRLLPEVTEAGGAAPRGARRSLESRTHIDPVEYLSPSLDRVGGRLRHFTHHWEDITSDLFVLSVIRNGYSLMFNEDGPPPLSNVPFVFNPPTEEEARNLLVEAACTMLDKGAVEIVGDISSPGFYSRLFLVPKRGGGWRPVIDLSFLNKFLVKETFKMETPSSIMKSMEPKEFTTSIDLKDAYFHIPIARKSQKYLRFVVMGKVYQFCALPFGIAPAPLVFTRVMGVVAAYAHRQGILVHMYLDDWLIRSVIREKLLTDTEFMEELCIKLGLIVNLPKSSLIPLQDFVFLGIQFETIPFLCRPSEDRFQRLLLLIRSTVRKLSVSARIWMRIIGTLTSMDTQVELGRLHRRPLQFSFRDRWDRRSLSQQIKILPFDRRVLHWWTLRSNVMQGVSLIPYRTQVTIFTDASLAGWGAHTNSLTVSGIWPPAWRHFTINWLEMQAIKLALIEFLPAIKCKHVLIMSDNKTAVAYINKQGGTRSKRLFSLAKQILLWCKLHQIRILCRHIRGDLNVLTDSLSRSNQIISTEWSLLPAVVQALWLLWGRPLIDLFATRDNYKLPTFVSPFPDDQAWAVDALAISWEGLWAYTYPPLTVVTQSVGKIQEES